MALFSFTENSTGDTAVFKSTLIFQDSKAVNVLKLTIKPTLNISIGDEVKFNDYKGVYIFGGIVKNISVGKTKELEVFDYSSVFLDTLINNVYRDLTPEAIISQIISSYTSFTFNSNITTTNILKKLVLKDEKLIDVLKMLSDLLAAEFYVDKNKNFFLELNSEKDSGLAITEGIDMNVSGWKYNTDKQAGQVVVKGGKTSTRTQEAKQGTNTIWTLAREPRDLKCWAALSPDVFFIENVEGKIDGNYSIDVQKKEVTFLTAVTDPVFEYSYDSQIKVTAGNGSVQKEIVKTYIETLQEARTLARNYLSKYEFGTLSAVFRVNSMDIEAYRPNQKIFVTDNFFTPNVSQYFQISKVVRKSNGVMEVTVGEVEANLFDWQKESQERIKQLELVNDNSDFIQIYEFIRDGVLVKVTVTFPRRQYRTIVAGALFWDSRNWDTANWNSPTSANLGIWKDF